MRLVIPKLKTDSLCASNLFTRFVSSILKDGALISQGKREQKRITSISQRDPARAKSQGDFEDPIIRIDGPMRPT